MLVVLSEKEKGPVFWTGPFSCGLWLRPIRMAVDA
jgi:hypothetical protein